MLPLLLIFYCIFSLYANDCGNQANEWKPCIERRIADQVFGACCDRFVPPECRGLCIYESNPIEARVVAEPLKLWGDKSLSKDLVVCLAKWDQIMFCHQAGLRARKIIKAPTAVTPQ